MNDETKHEIEGTLNHLWWIEYDTFGRDGIFDAIERGLRAMGADLPNHEYGGRAVKWKKPEPAKETVYGELSPIRDGSNVRWLFCWPWRVINFASWLAHDWSGEGVRYGDGAPVVMTGWRRFGIMRVEHYCQPNKEGTCAGSS